jgi:Fungal specific transcription factor domain
MRPSSHTQLSLVMASLQHLGALPVNSVFFLQCDETHPSCIQCNTAQLRCMYAIARSSGPAQASASPRASSQIGSSSISTIEPHSPNNVQPQVLDPPILNSAFSITGSGEDHFTVNLIHIQLFHHFVNETAKTIMLGPQESQTSMDVVLKAALSAPYLMQEILAISALHLSILHPAQREFYHHQASGLQTRALTIFNGSHLEVDAHNCISIVIFSSFLAMHSLCDVVSSPNDDFSNFLSNFIHCLDMHRGIRAITSHSWRFLRQSELQHVLEAGEALHRTDSLLGKECDELRALLISADLGQVSMQACDAAIDHLQRTFDMEQVSNGRNNSFASWPVLVPTEYIDLVMKRSPEALVILAHYAVVLHSHRSEWFIGEGGRYLINCISRHLGSYWDNWMAWPNSVLAGPSKVPQPPRSLPQSPVPAG